jgi:hypothetical protein
MTPGIFLEKNLFRPEKNFHMAPDIFCCFFDRPLVAPWKSVENIGFAEPLTTPSRKAKIFES